MTIPITGGNIWTPKPEAVNIKATRKNKKDPFVFFGYLGIIIGIITGTVCITTSTITIIQVLH